MVSGRSRPSYLIAAFGLLTVHKLAAPCGKDQGGCLVASIIIINPRFEVCYWGMEHARPLLCKRANLLVAALPLLAALTPKEHEVTLIDENVQAIDFDRAAEADIVCITGMSVQRFRMREILTELKERGAFTVVGGPWVSVQEDY